MLPSPALSLFVRKAVDIMTKFFYLTFPIYTCSATHWASLQIKYQVYLEIQAFLLALYDDLAAVICEVNLYNHTTTKRPNSS